MNVQEILISNFMVNKIEWIQRLPTDILLWQFGNEIHERFLKNVSRRSLRNSYIHHIMKCFIAESFL